MKSFFYGMGIFFLAALLAATTVSRASTKKAKKGAAAQSGGSGKYAKTYTDADFAAAEYANLDDGTADTEDGASWRYDDAVEARKKAAAAKADVAIPDLFADADSRLASGEKAFGAQNYESASRFFNGAKVRFLRAADDAVEMRDEARARLDKTKQNVENAKKYAKDPFGNKSLRFEQAQ